MTKALIKKLDALPDGAAMSVTVSHNGTTVAVIKNGVLLKRAPQPVGLAFEVVARTGHRASVFIMPHHRAELHAADDCRGFLLRVYMDDPAKSQPVIDPARVHAAAAKAGAKDFTQADLDEFMETVKRLAQRGIITLPKAQKGGRHG